METPLNEIREAIDELGKANKEFRDANDERLKALEKGDTAKARELDEKLDKIHVDLAKASNLKDGIDRVERYMEEVKERQELLEAKFGAPGISKIDKAERSQIQVFEKALRQQFGDPALNNELKQAERLVMEAKAITTTAGPSGGFAVPEEISRAIEKLERKLSPVRDLVRVTPIGTSDYKRLINLGGAASGWVGEDDTRTATGTPILREVTPTHGELYAYPQASEWSLDDAFFSIEQWLRDETAEEFAYQEGVAVISGDGTKKPTGMLNTAPVATADGASPLRAAAAYQFVAAANSPAAIDGDSLIDLVYAVNRRYRSNGRWTFNSLTAAAIRKLKDSNGAYHWQPGLSMGEPSTLLGYPTSVWEDMQDVGAGNHPVAFGDFQRAYELVDRVGMRITVDQVTNPGFVKYYIRRREGGIPMNNDAVKFLKTT